jgi:hypothetical protein
MTESLIPITKGVGQVAKLMDNAIPSPVANAVGNTLADVWQAIIGDRIAGWRITNAAKINDMLVQRLAKNGAKLDASKIPERYAFAWFEEASKQDEPEIQELFAKLLENAASGNNDALQRRNVELIGKFTPEDAVFLNLFIDIYLGNAHIWGSERTKYVNKKAVLENVLSKEHNFKNPMPLENLKNMGVLDIDMITKVDGYHMKRFIEAETGNSDRYVRPEYIIETHEEVSLTFTGQSLLTALFPEKMAILSEEDFPEDK